MSEQGVRAEIASAVWPSVVRRERGREAMNAEGEAWQLLQVVHNCERAWVERHLDWMERVDDCNAACDKIIAAFVAAADARVGVPEELLADLEASAMCAQDSPCSTCCAIRAVLPYFRPTGEEPAPLSEAAQAQGDREWLDARGRRELYRNMHGSWTVKLFPFQKPGDCARSYIAMVDGEPTEDAANAALRAQIEEEDSDDH